MLLHGDEAICDLGFLGFWVQLNRCMGILGFWIWDCKKFGNLDSGKWRELNRASVDTSDISFDDKS